MRLSPWSFATDTQWAILGLLELTSSPRTISGIRNDIKVLGGRSPSHTQTTKALVDLGWLGLVTFSQDDSSLSGIKITALGVRVLDVGREMLRLLPKEH